MNHFDILGTYEDFKYVLYTHPEVRLVNEFNRVHEIVKQQGHVVGSKWDLSGGIMLESDSKIVAGVFFNTTEYNSAILIHFAYVEPKYRQQGIYTNLHGYVDLVGRHLGKNSVYSYIHLSNTAMVDTISAKIGYTPIMQLVTRPIKDDNAPDQQ